MSYTSTDFNMSAMKCLMLTVLLYLVELSYSYKDCSVGCELLTLIPPRWQVNDTEVPYRALWCHVTSDCQLNLTEMVENNTDIYKEASHTVHLELYFNCSSDNNKLGKHFTKLINYFIYYYTGCDSNWVVDKYSDSCKPLVAFGSP